MSKYQHNRMTLIKYFLNPIHWPFILLSSLLILFAQCPPICAVPFLWLTTWLIRPALRRRRKTIMTNLRLCFPKLEQQALNKLYNQNLKDATYAFYDTIRVYLSIFFRRVKYQVEGLEHAKNALDKDHGAILLCGHFNSLFISGKLIRSSLRHPLANMFQQIKDPYVRFVYEKMQNKYFTAIFKYNIKNLIKALDDNFAVIYLTDLNDTSGKHFAPFFNIPAASNSAIVRIAKLSNTTVVPYVCFRLSRRKGYLLRFYPALDNFPSADLKKDLTRINQLIEDQIKEHPEQYMWSHRRFKTRPKGEPLIYKK